jgi:hypothetical protein
MDMNITHLELSAKDLPAQRDFIAIFLNYPKLDSFILEVKTGNEFGFTQAFGI